MSAMADGFVGSSSSSFDELVVGTAPESKKSDGQYYKGDEQEKSRDRNYKRTRRFQGRIAGNQVMFWRFL